MTDKFKEYEDLKFKLNRLELEITKDVHDVGLSKGFNWPLHCITNIFVGEEDIIFKVNGLPKRISLKEMK